MLVQIRSVIIHMKCSEKKIEKNLLSVNKQLCHSCAIWLSQIGIFKYKSCCLIMLANGPSAP